MVGETVLTRSFLLEQTRTTMSTSKRKIGVHRKQLGDAREFFSVNLVMLKLVCGFSRKMSINILRLDYTDFN